MNDTLLAVVTGLGLLAVGLSLGWLLGRREPPDREG